MENTPIRVLQILDVIDYGGIENVLMNYYRHIDRTKVQFDFVMSENSKLPQKAEIESYGGKCFLTSSYKHLRQYSKALKKIITENNYEIVHCHMGFLAVFPLRVAKKCGVKVRICHCHTTANIHEFVKTVIKYLLKPFSKKYATHYFACSEHAGRCLFGNKTYDKGEVAIINNAIDLEKFKFNQEIRDSLRKELGLQDSFVVGHVGRFMKQKNHKFLIDVFNEVQKKRKNAVLLLLGDGELLEDIKDYIKELGITEKVVFMGVHYHAERYYNIMDCFVFPSLYEGLGMVLVEAQVNGLQCIASDNVPVEAKITNKVQFISLDKSAKEWAEAVLKTDNAATETAVRTEDFDSKYNIRIQAEELCKIYENLKND